MSVCVDGWIDRRILRWHDVIYNDVHVVNNVHHLWPNHLWPNHLWPNHCLHLPSSINNNGWRYVLCMFLLTMCVWCCGSSVVYHSNSNYWTPHLFKQPSFHIPKCLNPMLETVIPLSNSLCIATIVLPKYCLQCLHAQYKAVQFNKTHLKVRLNDTLYPSDSQHRTLKISVSSIVDHAVVFCWLCCCLANHLCVWLVPRCCHSSSQFICTIISLVSIPRPAVACAPLAAIVAVLAALFTKR